ncbi:MAG: pre-16S rRNA-processing nuclease YqgF [Candidatus Yonathbacteria bacterium]|nr:pre-16S rRNA-processing nuclease YqgF [Candidatus Yonathbacteria bacterium]
MKYLGIDYGTKRVGIATGDSDGGMAFPHAVLPNNKKLIPTIKELCDREHINEIVLGESLDYKMKPNVIMEKIIPFKKELENATNLPVLFEREFMTSAAAEHVQGKGKMIDASAAAIILQSYLDRKRNSKQQIINDQ